MTRVIGIPVVAAGAQPGYFVPLGGAEAVTAIVESFYKRMDSLPEARIIRAMHGAELEPVKDVLRRYLTEWLGGPPLYSRERGHPRLRMRHQRFSIGSAERDAWMLCMRGALQDCAVDAQLRELLIRKFQEIADRIRNRPDDQATDLRP